MKGGGGKTPHFPSSMAFKLRSGILVTDAMSVRRIPFFLSLFLTDPPNETYQGFTASAGDALGFSEGI